MTSTKTVRAGRPSLTPAKRRSKHFTFRCRGDMREWLQTQAAAAGRSVSEEIERGLERLRAEAEQKYTLSEIDQMREIIQQRIIVGRDGMYWLLQPSFPVNGRLILNSDGLRYAEDQLRTYMTAGLGPKDLVLS